MPSTASPVADLSLTKVVTAPIPADPLVAGSPVTWLVTVTNNGPSDAANVQVTDPVPAALVTGVTATFGAAATPCSVVAAAVTCNLGSVSSGQTVVVTVNATVVATAPNGGLLTNTATVTSTTADPTTSNNSDTTESTIVTRADLGITKSPATANVDAGGLITYTFTVVNHGPSVAQTPTGVDVLPPGMTLDPTGAVIPPGWSCTPAGNHATCVDSGNLGVGESATLQVGFRVDSGLPAGTLLTDTATISSLTPDPNPLNDVASATATVTVSADVAITKTVTPSPTVAGGTATFTISVLNNGPSDAAGVSVSDPLPFPVVSADDISPSQGTCTETTNTVTCDLGVVSSGTGATITIVVAVPSNAVGTMSNTATVTSLTPDPDSDNNHSTVTDTIVNLADVGIVKTASATEIAAGVVVDYTLTVTNTGPSDAVGVTATDSIGPGFTPVPENSSPACTLLGSTFTSAAGTLTPSGTVSFVLEARADSALVPGDYVNTATVTATTLDPNHDNNTSSATVTVGRVADVSLVKSSDATIPAAGTQFTYTLSANNAGPSAAPSVVVTDTLPDALSFVSSPDGCTAVDQVVTCTTPVLDPGTHADFQVLVALASGAAPGPLTNTASVTADATDPKPANNTGSDTVTVQVSADLSIVKHLTSGPVVPGQPATYEITVTNLGPSDAVGVVVAESLPGATLASGDAPGGPCTAGDAGAATCPVGAMKVNTSAVFDVTFDVSPDATGSLSNVAIVSATSFDPVLDNNVATVTSASTPSADVSVTKTADASQFTAGGPVSWTMTVHNAGPSTALEVLVDDPLDPAVTGVTVTSQPAGVCTAFPCTIAVLPVGNTVTVLVSGTLAPSFTAPSLTASGSAFSATPDPNTGNNTATDVTPVVTSADLQVAKTGPEKVAAGTAIAWTVTVHNAGLSDAQDVVVTDDVPAPVTDVTAVADQGGSCTPGNAVSCTVATLAAGTTMTITISGSVAADAPLGPIANTATAVTTTTDPDHTNNSATATSEVAAVADLSLTKRFTSGPAVPGQSVTWELVASNAGPSTATEVVVTDPIPAGVTVTSVAPTALGCTVASNTLTCPIGTLASPASVTITVTGTLAASFSGTTLTNTATIDAATVDPTPDGNSASASTPVTPQAALSATKTVDHATVVQGGTAAFTITASNAGPSNATPLTITDPVPEGMTPRSATVPDGTCTIATATRVVTCTVPTLAVNATAVATVNVQVDADAAVGSITNTASVAADNVAGNVEVSAHAAVLIEAAPPSGTEVQPPPPVTSPPTPSEPSIVGETGGGVLPRTGAGVLQLVGVGAILLLAGVALARRRRGGRNAI